MIAGISGLITFVLASFGYDLFSRSKGTVIGIIVSAVAAAAVVYLAEYLCISFEIFKVWKDYGITFFEAVQATPEFLEEPELQEAVAKDLIFAYIFGAVAVVSNLITKAKAKKNAQ